MATKLEKDDEYTILDSKLGKTGKRMSERTNIFEDQKIPKLEDVGFCYEAYGVGAHAAGARIAKTRVPASRGEVINASPEKSTFTLINTIDARTNIADYDEAGVGAHAAGARVAKTRVPASRGEVINASPEKSTFTLINTIDVRTNIADYGRIEDFVVLNQNGLDVIVVWHSSENCVRSLWYDVKEDRDKISECKFPLSDCIRITKISNTQVAVAYTFGNELRLNIINVGPELRLQKQVSMKCSQSTVCITSVSSKTGTRLVIGQKGLMVTDLHGKMLKLVTVDKSGEWLVSKPQYLAATPSGHILVSHTKTDGTMHLFSGCENTYVSCISLERKVLWSYPINKARGVTCDAYSNVYVADRGFMNENVVMLSPEGKFVKEILKSDKADYCPQALYYDTSKARLYVSSKHLIRIYEHRFSSNDLHW